MSPIIEFLYTPGNPFKSLLFKKESDLKSPSVDFGEKRVMDNDGVSRRTAIYLGTPVFSDLILEGVDGVVAYLGEVLLVVSQTKNIVSTTVVGRNGTVKEYVSDGDYQVKMQGLIASNDTIYPKEAVLELLKLLKKAESLKVTSWFLQQFDIYNLVITDYSFPQNEGYENMQLFEISALSDTPVELIISD